MILEEYLGHTSSFVSAISVELSGSRGLKRLQLALPRVIVREHVQTLPSGRLHVDRLRPARGGCVRSDRSRRLVVGRTRASAVALARHGAHAGTKL